MKTTTKLRRYLLVAGSSLLAVSSSHAASKLTNKRKRTNMKNKHRSILPLAALSGIILTAPAHAAAVLLLSDNFDTADNNDINLNLSTRQDGTLENVNSNWTEQTANDASIVSNTLRTGRTNVTTWVYNNADLEPALTATVAPANSKFTLSFTMDYTGASGYWSSAYISTHTGDERATSRFGMIGFGTGDLQFYGGAVGGSQVVTSVSNTTLAGLISGWSINNVNTYYFEATRATTTTGTYNAFINGTLVASNVAYGFGGGGDRSGNSGEMNFEIVNVGNAGGNGAALFDNLSITTIPEPGAALIGSLGLLALLRRRRS